MPEIFGRTKIGKILTSLNETVFSKSKDWLGTILGGSIKIMNGRGWKAQVSFLRFRYIVDSMGRWFWITWIIITPENAFRCDDSWCLELLLAVEVFYFLPSFMEHFVSEWLGFLQKA